MGRKVVIYWTSVFILTFLVLLAYFNEVYFVAFWRKYKMCNAGNVTSSRPFYFGTTNVVCMQKVRKYRHKRSAIVRKDLPERKFWSMNHRWVFYEGWYFELFYRPHTRLPAKGKFCSFEREAKPAGFSTLPVTCLRKCAIYYNDRFAAAYDMWTHNCHNYANKLAELLCSESECPAWCDVPIGRRKTEVSSSVNELKNKTLSL